MEQDRGTEKPRTHAEVLGPGLEPIVLQNPKWAPGLETVYLRE